ncbi:WD40 repeat [Dillenia turbinata]|uniref:WD40 repeat n=1 Tax=Dillenia turbinata TaxID=194707 RepID=A0AAN8UBE0_9MAGN
MSQNSMASTTFFSCSSPSSSSFLAFSHNLERPDFRSIQLLVISINHYITDFVEDVESRKSLKSRCTSKLRIKNQEFFEFSEQSVLSNLYWGIESLEAAIQAKCEEERISRLENSEQMFQAPALLDEHGVTAGIENKFLVCCAYFYLSVVRNLQSDDWQAALHFLQALLVSAKIVQAEFAPQLCQSLFGSFAMFRRGLESATPVYFSEDGNDEAIRQTARIFKDWLTYYRIVSYGETPRSHCGSKSVPNPENKLKNFVYGKSASTKDLYSRKQRTTSSATYRNLQFKKVQPLEKSADKMSTKCQRMLNEYQSDSPRSSNSFDDLAEQDYLEAEVDDAEGSTGARKDAHDSTQSPRNKKLQPQRSISKLCSTNNDATYKLSSHKFAINVSDESQFLVNYQPGETTLRRIRPEMHDLEIFDHKATASLEDYGFMGMNYRVCPSRKKARPKRSRKDSNDELIGILERTISKLCFSEELRRSDEEYTVEVTTIYQMLNSKRGVKYALLKEVIIDQLLASISTSKEQGVIRASISILVTIAMGNMSVIKEIKKKGLQLCDLAKALKKNVHEAAILIYLINPSPTEIKSLELLPTLLEVVCTSSSYQTRMASLLVTPPAASLRIIEVLITAFDCATNNAHLEAINSPQVLSGLIEVGQTNKHEELVSLTTILVKCMQFDGQCRKYISTYTPFMPIIRLIKSNNKRAKFIALEFLHELLCMPRSSAITLLQKTRQDGNFNIMHMLIPCLQLHQPEYRLIAANLLLQLDNLEDLPGRSTFREEAMEILLKSVVSEESCTAQLLSAYILSNLGGTYSYTGEPYTVAWLVKKSGLTSSYHRNIIRNFSWKDQSLEDTSLEIWCSKMARRVIQIGRPVFQALETGLKSNRKRVSRDCLTAIAWLGCGMATSPMDLRYSACEILLSGIEQFLHPGSELEERLLACFSIYSYTSGKGMQKLIQFSEGVRESLRRLSNITWIAEELLKVADYFVPNKSRISCGHTQILEAGHKSSGAVTSLIYYKGHICSGFSDGSIKVWDMNEQSSKLLWDMKKHKKAVTCFTIFEPGDNLLSGSADKTIGVWQMIQGELECSEVIAMKEPIQNLGTYGQLIFVNTQSNRIRVIDPSRTVKDVSKSKHVKCMTVYQGKIFAGCTDSSIQELNIRKNQERAIKPRARSWRKQAKPINSIAVYKDCLYSASANVEGSSIKEWREHGVPKINIATGKGSIVLAMAVVEDFVYVNCSSSTEILQIWLRGTQQKVGRVSAGSRITSILTANDIVICGTETGLIKGWIPL